MSVSILVTGGAGYLGSILVPALLADGHKVTVLDNFLYQQASLNACCIDQSFSVVRGDVRDTVLVGRLLKNVDVVLPLAALVGAPLCDRDPFAATAVNRDAIVSMVKQLSNGVYSAAT